MRVKKCKICRAIVPKDAKGCTSCGSSLKSSKLFPSTRDPTDTQRIRTFLKGGVFLIFFIALVVTLVNQLEGTIELNRENGTAFVISFSVD